MKIIFATGNKNKLREINNIMKDSGYTIVSSKEEGISADPDEDGESFEENALIKARAVYEASDKMSIVMSDDSGLCIDALGGEPGIYSARFMGHDTSYDTKNAELIKRLDNVSEKERTARFVCAVGAILPSGKEIVVKEAMEGYIAHKTAGKNGFGYDPIFYLPEFEMTSAEISEEAKDLISHRGKAIRHMLAVLKQKESMGELS
ncbi:MAG: RdgB/HAM1 family non-canonical purine NTP pyrophosphatase [Lachnospiraceae bacterium]|nr:RdgB/HAM1 family non-canonical purine NTP pyrophosphatase [Lachnospiraceae bacterium]